MYTVQVARKDRRIDGFRVKTFGDGEGWTKRQALEFAQGKRQELAGSSRSKEKVTILKDPDDYHSYIVVE